MRIDLLLVLMVEALALEFVAKLARDRLLKRRGYLVNELVVGQRSLGAAVSQAGYLVGILLGFLGAISFAGRATGFLAMVGHVALFGLVAIVLHLSTAFLIMFRFAPTLSPVIGAINFPIFLQEMVMAVWLIVKGFNLAAIAAQAAR